MEIKKTRVNAYILASKKVEIAEQLYRMFKKHLKKKKLIQEFCKCNMIDEYQNERDLIK